jgi:hypothetical protein
MVLALHRTRQVFVQLLVHHFHVLEEGFLVCNIFQQEVNPLFILLNVILVSVDREHTIFFEECHGVVKEVLAFDPTRLVNEGPILILEESLPTKRIALTHFRVGTVIRESNFKH